MKKDCPDSSCVCESELGLRLRTLHDDLLRVMDEKGGGGGATVVFNSDNSSFMSEEVRDSQQTFYILRNVCGDD